MCGPSTFSETRLRSSFFLTTPAKKPRTECCCHSVVFMIAAIVVPLGRRNIASTASCLDDERAGAFADATFVVATSDVFGFDRAVPLVRTVPFAARDDFRSVFADSGFDLLVVIWLSLA